ncbi:saccharopine dehydrogenase NADP-binding domain-containing protein [Alkalimarinus coralli]|uniref:saccharopine dehydrogenase NADP-binding domain-containing protein n=1 Tax=Alkalimarinus coralli TaxID=2935863 RepID=UPI00202B66C8|nr:saccharopine dehydrogenase NADP-binding domain-containing protein [Alkalimarinus coralli]
MKAKTVLILGGYGNFGKRIAENLKDVADAKLLIAGRSLDKATQLAEQLQQESRATIKPIALDINKEDFEERLKAIAPHIVIHTGGPFQGQDYRVPQSCINIGAHYIDLADDRRFVCDIKTLDASAKRKGVLLVSGASSVPGLSSTVVEHYQHLFSSINSIDIAIAPGNKAERGEATVKAILSYTGRPFKVFSKGRWGNVYGWMNPRKVDFGDNVGQRWLANVDVPELELFPERYSVKDFVRFQAGLELWSLHLPMVAMAYLAKIKLVKSWAPLSKLIVRMSELFLPFGTDKGAMHIHIKGVDSAGKAKHVIWSLYAHDGVGPYIPTMSATIIARKLLKEQPSLMGATPCLGLYELDEFASVAKEKEIYFKEQIIG